MRPRLFFITPILLAVALLGATAQEPSAWFFAGPCGGFSYGAQTGAVPVYAGSTECGIFEPGVAIGGWGGAEILMPRLFAPQLGISAQLAWQRLSGTMEALPVNEQSATDTETGQLVELDRRYRFRLTTSTLRFDLLARYQSEGWGLALGPWIGYRLDVASEQTDDILGPNGLRHADGQQSHRMTEGIAATATPLALGFSILISHELPAGHHTILVPQLAASAELTSPVREAETRRLTLDGGLALLFDLTPSKPSPPPVAVEKPPHVPRLAATIRLSSGVDGSERVTTVHATEILYRKYTPLLPVLFFERDSASLSQQYLHPRAIDPDSLMLTLRGMEALDVHQHTPDIIGMRMQQTPDAHLTIYGATSLQEAPSLAAARAAATRDYLTKTWKIPRSRIMISPAAGPMGRSGEATEDGREENRRVEFASGTRSILEPIASERIVQEFTPPSITMEPTIESEAGWRYWSITIRQGGEVVARYASDDSLAGRSTNLTWNIPPDAGIDSVPSPIRVELTVEDSTGATVTAHDELPIVMERRVNVVEKREEEDVKRISYQLVAFDYNSAEPSTEHRTTLKEIAAGIGPDAHVRVVGYTDRIGGEGYNAGLSERRAARVAMLLRDELQQRDIGTVPVVSTGGGIDAERFGNDTPQGRILSRGVLIVVEYGAARPGEK